MSRLRQLPWRAMMVRLMGFAALWWVLTEGEPYRLWFGLSVAGAAVWVSLAVWPSGQWHWPWQALLRFLPFFLWRSVLGGLDVARRAFAPRPRLQPGLRRVRLRLQGQGARVFLVWVITLCPGTAGVRLRGDRLVVHVLDAGFLTPASLRALEAQVAALFGESLS